MYTWGHNRVGQLGYTNSEAVPRNHEGAFFLPKPRVVESLRGLRVRKASIYNSQVARSTSRCDGQAMCEGTSADNTHGPDLT